MSAGSRCNANKPSPQRAHSRNSAGALGYGISCPLWQMKTRLQAEAGLLAADGKTMATGRRAGLPRLYANTADGLRYIVRNDGVANLYRGTTPLMVRGALMNAGNTLGCEFDTGG